MEARSDRWEGGTWTATERERERDKNIERGRERKIKAADQGREARAN